MTKPVRKNNKPDILPNKQTEKGGAKFEMYQSIIPHPDHLKAFGEIDPSFPAMILQMTQDGLVHGREMDKKYLSTVFKESMWGNIFALLFALAMGAIGTYFMLKGHAREGASIICITVVAGLGIFITKTWQQKKEESPKIAGEVNPK